MKRLIIVLLAILYVGALSAAESAPADQVIVRQLGVVLPANTEAAAAFMWEQFANKPDEKKFWCSTGDWRKHWDEFRAVLLAKAAEQKLDAGSLEKVLTDIDRTRQGRALLPVGAYFTQQAGAPVWIVVCKWEYPPRMPFKLVKTAAGLELQAGPEYGLGHICMYAYSIPAVQQVAYQTCF